MIETLLHHLNIPVWRLRGYDTFAGEWYPLDGIYLSERAALRAAHKRLKELERLQPSDTSGGQEGIQDQVYIVRPDGTMFRYLPPKNRS
ncbi:MAG: hypothetical protein HXY42_08040 [Chloroflexi bacterium]|nr:hypothetical protein [Chloroflexota bacterium]